MESARSENAYPEGGPFDGSGSVKLCSSTIMVNENAGGKKVFM